MGLSQIRVRYSQLSGTTCSDFLKSHAANNVSKHQQGTYRRSLVLTSLVGEGMKSCCQALGCCVPRTQ